MKSVTIALSVEDLRCLLICAELWGHRMLRIKPQLAAKLRAIAESVETQVGTQLTVTSALAMLKHKETTNGKPL